MRSIYYWSLFNGLTSLAGAICLYVLYSKVDMYIAFALVILNILGIIAEHAIKKATKEEILQMLKQRRKPHENN